MHPPCRIDLMTPIFTGECSTTWATSHSWGSCVWVRVCRCVGVWVCGCVGVCGYVWVCVSVGVGVGVWLRLSGTYQKAISLTRMRQLGHIIHNEWCCAHNTTPCCLYWCVIHRLGEIYDSPNWERHMGQSQTNRSDIHCFLQSLSANSHCTHCTNPTIWIAWYSIHYWGERLTIILLSEYANKMTTNSISCHDWYPGPERPNMKQSNIYNLNYTICLLMNMYCCHNNFVKICFSPHKDQPVSSPGISSVDHDIALHIICP